MTDHVTTITFEDLKVTGYVVKPEPTVRVMDDIVTREKVDEMARSLDRRAWDEFTTTIARPPEPVGPGVLKTWSV